jgi:hypothetical protein
MVETGLLKLFNHLIAQRLQDFQQDLGESFSGYQRVLPAGRFPLEGLMCDLLEKVLKICRTESGGHVGYARKSDVSFVAHLAWGYTA